MLDVYLNYYYWVCVCNFCGFGDWLEGIWFSIFVIWCEMVQVIEIFFVIFSSSLNIIFFVLNLNIEGIIGFVFLCNIEIDYIYVGDLLGMLCFLGGMAVQFFDCFGFLLILFGCFGDDFFFYFFDDVDVSFFDFEGICGNEFVILGEFWLGLFLFSFIGEVVVGEW